MQGYIPAEKERIFDSPVLPPGRWGGVLISAFAVPTAGRKKEKSKSRTDKKKEKKRKKGKRR